MNILVNRWRKTMDLIHVEKLERLIKVIYTFNKARIKKKFSLAKKKSPVEEQGKENCLIKDIVYKSSLRNLCNLRN